MPANSSSSVFFCSTNISVPGMGCINATVYFSYLFLTFANILVILPLCISVLSLGFRQWRAQSSREKMTNSDFFTYHMAVIELMSVLGSTLYFSGLKACLWGVMATGVYLYYFNLSGQMFFLSLTCVERYLAVVYPISYLNLKQTKGMIIRNVTVCCVWMLCTVWMIVMYSNEKADNTAITYCCFLTVALIIISFCSLHVVCVLIRPGPGERSVHRQRLDQSKLKALCTIMAILGVVLLMFGGNIFYITMSTLQKLTLFNSCTAWALNAWLSLPSSVVLPLMYLRRARKQLRF